MKNSAIENLKFPFFVDVRDYLSSTIFTKSSFDQSIDANNDVLIIETSEKNRPFDLFAHILEG